MSRYNNNYPVLYFVYIPDEVDKGVEKYIVLKDVDKKAFETNPKCSYFVTETIGSTSGWWESDILKYYKMIDEEEVPSYVKV